MDYFIAILQRARRRHRATQSFSLFHANSKKFFSKILKKYKLVLTGVDKPTTLVIRLSK